MLNKNDPLIGAVQEVMKKNQAEREAARMVNEKFGVHDRKALPHEKQGAWDAAYKSVLNEALHPNQQKLDVHEPEKDELTKKDFEMLHAKKSMEEATDGDTTSPSSMGIKKPDYTSGTPDYANKGPQMVNRAAKTSLPAGTMKEEEQIDEAGMMPKGAKRLVAKAVAGVKAMRARSDKKFADKYFPANSPSPSDRDINKGRTEYAAKATKLFKRLEEREMTSSEKTKEEKLKLKLDPSGMKASMQKQYGKEKGKDVYFATIRKKAMKEDNEGFNNRHDSSVTASDENQVVADQLNERISSTAQRKAQLAPIHTQGIKQTKARLAREPAEPAKSFSQRAAEIGRGVEAGARGFASGLTDVGQTDYGYPSGSDYVLDKIMPGRGKNLAREFPRTTEVGKGFGNMAGFVAGPEAAVIKGITKAPKLASDIYRGLRSGGKAANATVDATKAAKTGSSFTPTAKPTQQYANAADELSSGARARFQRTLDAKMAAGGPAKKPVSQAAREPAAAAKASQPSVTRTVADPNSPIAKAVRDGNAAKKPTDVDKFIAKAKETPVTPAGKQPNIPTGSAGTRGTFRDKLAQARRNAGSDPKARQLPALRGTTQPTNYVRPGVPAVRPTPSTALARPGMPNLAAGGKTRIVGLSPLGKAAAGATIAAGAAGTYLATKNSSAPATATAAAKKDQSKVPQSSEVIKPQPKMQDRVPEQSSTNTAAVPKPKLKPQQSAVPAKPAIKPTVQQTQQTKPTAPVSKPVAPTQPVRKAAPQASSTPAQRAQFNRQIDRGIAAPGTQHKGLGTSSGTTVKQKPMAINKNLPGK